MCKSSTEKKDLILRMKGQGFCFLPNLKQAFHGRIKQFYVGKNWISYFLSPGGRGRGLFFGGGGLHGFPGGTMRIKSRR